MFYTYFSGWVFITNLLQISWDDTAMRTAYLMYLNGVKDCASIPGGCTSVVTPQSPTPQPPALCPDPTITIQQPTLFIQKTAPNNPLVIGQDIENRRGAECSSECKNSTGDLHLV